MLLELLFATCITILYSITGSDSVDVFCVHGVAMVEALDL